MGECKIVERKVQKSLERVKEPYALQSLSKIFTTLFISPNKSSQPIETTFTFFPSSRRFFKKKPIVLLHGFDSSCLEYRRLAPLLNGEHDVFVPDIFGWGFATNENVKECSATSKEQHMKSFIEQVVKEKCILVGTSLGGALAINLSSVVCPQLVDKLVLINAQGFIDGSGLSALPESIARLGVKILKSRIVRSYVNKIAYVDKRLATVHAIECSLLHCSLPDKEDKNIAFIKCGGFIVSKNVPKILQETLVLWGEKDVILELSTAKKFEDNLPNGKLIYIPDCGHVPHLEKPKEVAEYILKFC